VRHGAAASWPTPRRASRSAAEGVAARRQRTLADGRSEQVRSSRDLARFDELMASSRGGIVARRIGWTAGLKTLLICLLQ
jgi:hypothetical protein